MKKRNVYALFALLLTLSACATSMPSTSTSTVPPAFDASIYQAAVFRPENLRPLKPVVPDGNGNVTVTTVKGPGQWNLGPLTTRGAIWISLVPEVQDKCRAYHGADLAMYLRQIIGLQPAQPVEQFITMSVRPEQLYRPTPDPRTDTIYPCLDPVAKTDCNVFPKDVDPLHEQWIAETFLTVRIPNGYPWTHLGYTYNWGPGDRYGASEYILRPGSNVTVTQVTTIADYCGR